MFPCFTIIDVKISIHALLAESDLYSSSSSTPAVHFYPRSPCGERRCEMISIERCSFISIQALLAESDLCILHHLQRQLFISIHALLAESDSSTPAVRSKFMHFYPRSPCGERRVPLFYNNRCQDFYPRSPCGERPIIAEPLR